MIPVLDNLAMREADRVTIEDLGLPGMVLMEAAAAAVSDALQAAFAAASRVVVVCGPGNNGGDGLACARQLHCRGFDVVPVLLAAEAALSPDARRQLELARSFGLDPESMSGDDFGSLAAVLDGGDVVVDALFGTGLDRPLEGRWAAVVETINLAGRPVVAVDVPSGLSGSRSTVLGATIEAALTVTFGAPKLAHVLPPACLRCGKVGVAEIGIPPWKISRAPSAWMLEPLDVAGWLPARVADAHKGKFGHLVLVAGRLGRAGAAGLAARAAVASGCGLVTVVTGPGAVTPVQVLVPEAMVDSLGSAGEAGGHDVLAAALARATAVGIGPGIGLDAGAAGLLDQILAEWAGPLLIDADALTLLAGRLGSLRGRAGSTVLTPHPGELARLLVTTTEAVVDDRITAAQAGVAASGAVVVAKGARTIIAGPEQVPWINPTGTSGLASGGSGDSLTGTIAAFLAQGVSAPRAAALGTWLHGRAAELAAEQFPSAVPAGELANRLPAAEAELRALP